MTGNIGIGVRILVDYSVYDLIALQKVIKSKLIIDLCTDFHVKFYIILNSCSGSCFDVCFC